MAGIYYATILNSFVSTDNSMGYMSSYVFYSVLVCMTDGSRKVVEGKAPDIAYLLPYIRTPQDELQILRQEMDELKSTVAGLRSELQSSFTALREELGQRHDGDWEYLVESLYPIPELQGLEEDAAVKKLEEAGFRAVLKKYYPEQPPRKGIVLSCRRSPERFKELELELGCTLPQLEGLSRDEALTRLSEEGFAAEIREEESPTVQDGFVISCSREDPRSMEAVLTVSKKIPDVLGKDKDEALAILTEDGYEVICKPVFLKEGDWNKVLTCRSTEGNSRELTVTYASDAAALPIKGMMQAEAETYLQENDIRYSVGHTYGLQPRGMVYDWSWVNLDEHGATVALFVSDGMETMKSWAVKLEWETMQGSSGDSYEAKAIYKQKSKELMLKLNYTINAKTSHTVTAAYFGDEEHPRKNKAQVYQESPMETGKPGVFALTMKYPAVPEELSLILVTQYGLLQKEEEIRLDLSFQW